MQEAMYRTILEQIEDGVYFVDLERRITFWNQGAERITGYTADEVMFRSCTDGILRHVSESGHQLCLHGCPLAAVMRDGKPREGSLYLHHKAGHRVPITVKGSALRDVDGNIVGSVEVFHRRSSTWFADLSRRERSEDALIDPLTDLGNRRFAHSQIPSLIAAAQAGGSSLGVVFLDIDEFKTVNDTQGHSIGDSVLRMVGQSLANGLRAADMPVRWGGEEFLVLLPGVSSEILATLAERLRMLVEHSWIQVGDTQVRVTVSVGAVMVRPGETFDEALDRADRLMYQSKAAGRNVVTTESGRMKRRGQVPLFQISRPWDMDPIADDETVDDVADSDSA